MNTEITTGATRLDDAVYALAQMGHELDAGALDALVRQYPEHAAHLTALAIELILDADDDDSGDVVASPSAAVTATVSSAMSHFQNQLYEVDLQKRSQQHAAAAKPQNIFSAWDRTELRAFSTRLGANTVFAIKVRDRLLETDTLTPGFQAHVADAARVPLEAVTAHFAGEAQVHLSAQYKADRKPEAGKKQAFAEAVRTSGLTDEQQAFLLSL